MTTTKRISLLLIAGLTLGGCAVIKEDNSRWQPPPVQAPVYQKPEAGAIYNAGTDIRLFEDRKASRVGDILAVLLTESTNASKNSATSTGKSTEATLLNPTVLGRPTTHDGMPLFSGELSGDSNFDGRGSSSQSNTLAGDQAYTPGTNDPVLAADESVSVFLVNDIPGTVANGDIGRSQLTATSLTGSGTPGTVFAGLGDGGVDAVVGTTGGEASDTGEYLVSDVLISIVKAQAVADQFGGTEPIPGATLTYTITVEVQSAGTATASVVRDPIPTFTTYVADSITLNGGALTDLVDADAGEFEAGTPQIVVRLGDLTQADGVQTIVFQVTID